MTDARLVMSMGRRHLGATWEEPIHPEDLTVATMRDTAMVERG